MTEKQPLLEKIIIRFLNKFEYVRLLNDNIKLRTEIMEKNDKIIGLLQQRVDQLRGRFSAKEPTK